MLNSTYTCNKNWSRKNGGKDGKVLYKLMKNSVHGIKMENVRIR